MKNLAAAGLGGDRKAICVAVLCFLHCVAGPVLLSFAGFASLIGVSEKFEPVILVSSIAMGAATLIPAYRKRHGRISCLALFFGGLFCLLVRRCVQWTIVPEAVAVGLGAGLVVAAHALNLSYSKKCGCCAATSVESTGAQPIAEDRR
jgi:hypothetical protein